MHDYLYELSDYMDDLDTNINRAHFLSLMKEIEFLLKLQHDTPKDLCSLFEKPIIVNEDNKGATALVVASQMKLRTKPIAVKYHHFQSFVANGDVEIQHIDTKEQILDIFTNLLDYELS